MIIGAGLSGLIAAHAFPSFPVMEAGQPKENHKALLRFRTDNVAKLTGINFKSVTVRKGIYDLDNQRFAKPNIFLANQYALKMTGFLTDRSIWNIEPAKRWVAPEDFYERLLNSVGSRISWNTKIDPLSRPAPLTLSTAPLSLLGPEIGLEGIDFRRAAIAVDRYRIPDSEIYQTIYIPSRLTSLYRVSITGDLLIAESVMSSGLPAPHCDLRSIIHPLFGIEYDELVPVDRAKQDYGKIAPIPDAPRRSALRRLTTEYGVYSLGRFATWRNILLDDLIQDIGIIKRMMEADAYDATKMMR